MKVEAITSINEIFVKGDILELESVLFEEDVELFPEQTRLDKASGKHIVVSEAVIAKKGTYKSYVLTNNDGRRYSEESIRFAVGYRPLNKLFIHVKETE